MSKDRRRKEHHEMLKKKKNLCSKYSKRECHQKRTMAGNIEIRNLKIRIRMLTDIKGRKSYQVVKKKAQNQMKGYKDLVDT